MSGDLSANQIRRIWESLASQPDSDEPLVDSKWSDWARECPAAVSWTLAALDKKDLSNAFRAKYREQVRTRRETSAGYAPRFRGRQKMNFGALPALPAGSFALQAQIELSEPMMTRDDQLFAVSDNAVRKDKAFGWPHMAASSWKGAFRAALFQMGFDSRASRSEHDRIWGVASDNEETGPGEVRESSRAGRLHFYTTFFEKIDFRMLNPQDRELRSGNVPVEMEVVPPGDKGWFQLLYVPFDKPGGAALDEAKEDWRIVGRVVETMLRQSGFGAKTSLGYGSAKNEVAGARIAARGLTDWKQSSFRTLSELPESTLPGL